MSRSRSSISKAQSYEQISEFWDSHDLATYWDQTHKVEFEVDLLSRDTVLSSDDAKKLGAYYTDAQIADFLVWWAIRSDQDSVLDPSFGGGVFLRSASGCLLRLGGRPRDQVFGVEIDPVVHSRVSDDLANEFGVRKQNLLLSDFFDVDQNMARQVDVIVGNPPFIRYQRFSGGARKQALRRAMEQGVKLSALSSSWAPFLVHCAALLKLGGRLAMVIPVEVGHAAYALPVLDYLYRSFGAVTFLTFQKKTIFRTIIGASCY